MKKYILATAVLLISGGAFAQNEIKKATSLPPARFGIRAGVNLPTYNFDNNTTESETNSTVNFHVTGYGDFPINNNFSIQPGISLQGKGAKYFDNGNNELEDNVLTAEIPLNFVGKINAGGGQFYLGAGPYVGFNIAGQRESTILGVETERDLNFGSDAGDDLRTIDFGLNFLGGYRFNNGFLLGGGYGYGLTNLVPEDRAGDTKQTNRIWSFSVGYSF